MSGRFVLAQISDMHLRASPREDGFDPTASLRQAFSQIRELGVDAIIATGDLVNDARAEEYAVLGEALRDPPAPLFLTPGNHDDPALLRSTFPSHTYLPASGPLSYVVDEFPVRLVSIDQTVYGETAGDFTPQHAAWLEARLSEAPAKPTLIALHHPPFRTQDRLLDTIGLRHSERFAEIVARHAQVGLVICGHHHRPVTGRVAQAIAVVAPSTAWSFGLALNEGQPFARKEPLMRGWALHVWTAETGFASHFMGL